MDEKVRIWFILFLFVFSGVIYYHFTEKYSSPEVISREVLVSRVIDGDTLELDNSERVRLLGINTPEKDMPYHDEAMNFLVDRIEGKKVILQSFYGKDKDKYGRTLGYIFIVDSLINEEVLLQGFANLYVYEQDANYLALKEAENYAIKNGRGIWKHSSSYGCLELLEFKYNEGERRCSNSEILRLKNSCNKTLEVIIKDSANHIFEEKISSFVEFSKNFSCVWNDDGDSLFIRDSDGIIFYYSY